jgi:hypothetical protein
MEPKIQDPYHVWVMLQKFPQMDLKEKQYSNLDCFSPNI